MQYILTEEEYKALKSNSKLLNGVTEKQLQTLCTKIADEMPVKWGWGGPDPKPWGCIKSVEDGDEWYCDSCPVQDICPEPYKEWSK
jgi:hypothetical protein